MVIPKAIADSYKEAMGKDQLVFLTKENEQRLTGKTGNTTEQEFAMTTDDEGKPALLESIERNESGEITKRTPIGEENKDGIEKTVS